MKHPTYSGVRVKVERRTGQAEQASSRVTGQTGTARSGNRSAHTEWLRNVKEEDESDTSAERSAPAKRSRMPVRPVRGGAKRGKRITKFSCNLCPFFTKRKAGMALHLRTHKRAGSLSQASPRHSPEIRNESIGNEGASRNPDTSSPGKATPDTTQDNIRTDSSGSKKVADTAPSAEKKLSTPQKQGTPAKTGDLAKSPKPPESSHSAVRSQVIKEPLQLRCHVCPFVTKYQATLFVHIKSHATKKNSNQECFSCKLCPYTTKFKSHLDSHIRVHTGEKPFKCTECPRAFSEKGNLVAHVRTHTGEAPFKCSLCNRAFNQKPLLRRHILNHVGLEKEQP